MGTMYYFRHCIACGPENPIGFNIKFYKGDGFVYGKTIIDDRFEGYENIAHGGVLSILLDEVMAKALFAADIVAVTMEINVKFRREVLVGQQLTLKGFLTDVKRKVAFTHGKVLLPDGGVAAEANAKFFITSGEKKEQMLAGLSIQDDNKSNLQ
ncbi:MAG: PaaI family thioesterase [candidate division Zixibacteria bacterium]|nr:PaaI family thioesterase [candidate division Zixibacteria bacterium]